MYGISSLAHTSVVSTLHLLRTYYPPPSRVHAHLQNLLRLMDTQISLEPAPKPRNIHHPDTRVGEDGIFTLEQVFGDGELFNAFRRYLNQPVVSRYSDLAALLEVRHFRDQYAER